MIQSLLYVRVEQQAPTTYAVPLLEELKQDITALTVFEFDNFSEESIRQYATTLLQQSTKIAIVVVVSEADAPITGIASFFNRLLKIKPESMLLVLQGTQPTLQKMMEATAKNTSGPGFFQHLPATDLKQLLVQFFR